METGEILSNAEMISILAEHATDDIVLGDTGEMSHTECIVSLENLHALLLKDQTKSYKKTKLNNLDIVEFLRRARGRASYSFARKK